MSLEWSQPGEAAAQCPGITYLELLAAFCLHSGRFPPRIKKHGHRVAWTDLLCGQGLLQPIAVTEALLTFVTVVTLTCKAGFALFPGPSSNQVRTVQGLGSEPRGRKGLQSRPELAMEGEVLLVLQSYGRNRDGECFRQACLRQIPTEVSDWLTDRWNAAESSRVRRRLGRA